MDVVVLAVVVIAVDGVIAVSLMLVVNGCVVVFVVDVVVVFSVVVILHFFFKILVYKILSLYYLQKLRTSPGWIEIYHDLKLGAERIHIAHADRAELAILPLLWIRDLA